MMLREAAEAAFDFEASASPAIADAATREAVTTAIARSFWTYVWPRIKDDRLKVSVWFLRPSVRVSALQPLFALVFGEAPDA